MRILYVEHGSLISGGQRSLLELLRALPSEIGVALASPAGPLEEQARRQGIAWREIPGTTGSFRLHPLHTTRMLADLLRMAREVRRAQREGGFDVVHANSVRAGLAACGAFGVRRLRRRPLRVVVHVRDALPRTPAGRAVRAVISAGADEVVAISRHIAADFGSTGARIVHNPVDAVRFAPRTPRKRPSGLPECELLLAVVAQITPWKGQDDAIQALSLVRAEGVDARLAIVGEAKFVSRATRYDNRAFDAHLRQLAVQLELDDAVVFTGEREDTPDVLAGVDILLAPSWEEPFGRSIIEAMACGSVVVATSRGGPPEIITDGVDGLLLPPRQPRLWAQAVLALAKDPARRLAIGDRARRTALERFAPEDHVRQMLDLYRGQRRPG